MSYQAEEHCDVPKNHTAWIRVGWTHRAHLIISEWLKMSYGFKSLRRRMRALRVCWCETCSLEGLAGLDALVWTGRLLLIGMI